MNTNTQSQIIQLDDLTTLHVTGSDASKFLHAQFTNDLANLPVNSWQYSGYCTPKGRLLAFMTIARVGENKYLLILPADISESILPRLRMFVMRDDVTISPQQGQVSIAGIVSSAEALSTTGLVFENETGRLTNEDSSYLLTIDDEAGRYLYIGNIDSIKALSLPTTHRGNWTVLDIQSGIPAILATTQEAFVPQMVNLDLIGAVNFKKGCYPGQEIVARVHYLGKIKQRMYVMTTSHKGVCNPGDKLYITGQEDKTAGTVVQVADIDPGQILQVVLQTKAVTENAEIQLGTGDGIKLILATQPYPVEDIVEK